MHELVQYSSNNIILTKRSGIIFFLMCEFSYKFWFPSNTDINNQFPAICSKLLCRKVEVQEIFSRFSHENILKQFSLQKFYFKNSQLARFPAGFKSSNSSACNFQVNLKSTSNFPADYKSHIIFLQILNSQVIFL